MSDTYISSSAAPTSAEVADAVAAAVDYAATPLGDIERCVALRRAAGLVLERTEEIAQLLVEEVAKPIALARVEVVRAAEVFELSASQWETLGEEVVPTRTSPAGKDHLVLARRFPVGVVCAISPFNFPIGLTAHKVAPALAAGNACVVKPSERAPRSVAALTAAIVDAGFPAAAIPTLSGGRETVEALLADERIALYTFTGSVGVGERVKALSGLRPVVLELGSNAATIVHADADLKVAAAKLAQGAYAFAGQACFSVQRIIAQEDVRAELLDLLAAEIAGLAVGDPHDQTTIVGPLIDEAAAARVAASVQEALAAGARLVCGGDRDGALMQPTLLDDLPTSCSLWREEAFGPVAGVVGYDTLGEAFDLANDSRFGLQSGIFTASSSVALTAVDALRAGAVLVNESSSWRCTPMPFGGVGASGIGREGPRYAIESMTELRTAVLAR